MMDKANDHASYSDLDALKDILLKFDTYKGNADYIDKTVCVLLKTYVNSQIARLFRRRVKYESKNERAVVKKDLYYQDGIETFLNEHLENLNDAFYKNLRGSKDYYASNATNIKIISRKNYIEIIKTLISFTYTYRNSQNEIIKESISEGTLKNLNIVHNGNKYYKTEFFVCLLLDIAFSAIKYGFDSDLIGKSKPNALDVFSYLIENNKVVNLNISIVQQEGASFNYLRFENKVNNKLNSFEVLKKSLKESLSAQGRGFSLSILKWYIESLWNDVEHDDHIVNIRYEKKEDDIVFVIELPVIQK